MSNRYLNNDPSLVISKFYISIEYSKIYVEMTKLFLQYFFKQLMLFSVKSISQLVIFFDINSFDLLHVSCIC